MFPSFLQEGGEDRKNLRKKSEIFLQNPLTIKNPCAIISYVDSNAENNADMAQLVERVLGKDEVPGSNPGISSKITSLYSEVFGFYKVISSKNELNIHHFGCNILLLFHL